MVKGEPDNTPGNRKKQSEFFRYLGVASTVGINLVVCTFVGFAIGYWVIDRFLGTFPWFTLIFLIIGIATGFRYLLRIAFKQRDNGNS
ncbi:MAG: AtpZ/AtpI family protein [Nitrospiraceae bacterium]|nr:MAG: AtpZ/AtpI family protein [Nitrospiraceae bacterium]